MKVFVAALAFAFIAAVGVAMVLNTFQEPSSVAFSTIHSNRSNLMSAAHNVMLAAGGGDATGSKTRNTIRSGRASTISATCAPWLSEIS